MTAKTLSANVTTLDLIKTFAVICMIIDHLGFYFFPDSSWFRVVGRLGGAPIWFFLIGYASSRDIPVNWMIGALMLAVVEFALIGAVFPVNVLVTLILLRLSIDPIMNIIMQTRYLFWLCMPILALFYIPTNMAVEYGTLAALCAVLGYLVKHRERLETVSFLTKRDFYGFATFTVVANVLLQRANFGFSELQSFFLFVAIASITAMLVNLKVEDIPQIKNKTLSSILQFYGRNTLEIYVGHVLAFIIIFWVLFLMGFYQ